MTPRKERMTAVSILLIAVSLATFFGLRGCDNLKEYFFDPSEVVAGAVKKDQEFRLGGMVKENSFKRTAGSLDVRFIVTDFAEDVIVRYSGLLPDLFREGQGVVATGRLNDAGEFEAHTIFAKHDENYMPPEVAESLKTQHPAKTSEPRP
ncbi:MAG: cytochrome c maturation protein CcmE [Gammaproteobacteria bacterium]|nr:cytochrome c maturation protein CcmE [Gammaproteobacteria bacterium]